MLFLCSDFLNTFHVKQVPGFLSTKKMMAWMDDPDLGAVQWQHGARWAENDVCYAAFRCISAFYTFLKGSVSIDARRCVRACVGTFYATEYVGTM
jgi:hypothetical protein